MTIKDVISTIANTQLPINDYRTIRKIALGLLLTYGTVFILTAWVVLHFIIRYW